jgi:hypothetical protein
MLPVALTIKTCAFYSQSLFMALIWVLRAKSNYFHKKHAGVGLRVTVKQYKRFFKHYKIIARVREALDISTYKIMQQLLHKNKVKQL